MFEQIKKRRLELALKQHDMMLRVGIVDLPDADATYLLCHAKKSRFDVT